MQIRFCSVMVEDQQKALRFYTEVLGFRKHSDIDLGEYRWLTVTSPATPEGMELVLEPLGFPPARTYQKALFDAGIPITAFITENIDDEYSRLVSLGVVFRGKPEKSGPITSVIFEDTCGNLVNLVQTE